MITRNNYEELFLLYVDNELSVAERATVEQFVQDNPDLEAELTQLQLSILRPEVDLFFSNKESLLRDPMAVESEEGSLLRGELPVWAGESSFVDEGNYPVYLLSYIDNELDEESRKTVANHVLQHPRLEEELAILQRTRLEPDLSVVFDGKDLLYKPEYSNRWAILSWSRIAAAILLLIAALLLFDKTKQKARRESGDSRIAGNTSRYMDLKDLKNETVFLKDSQAVTPHAVDPLYSKKDVLKDIQVRKSKETAERTVNPDGRKNESGRHESPAIQARQRAEEDSVAITRPADKKPDCLPTYQIKSPSTTRETIGETTRGAALAGNKDNTIAKDNTIVLASEGIPIEDPSANKKNKLRGLFRKVTRVFGKATNADDDNNDNNKHGVLIGSFKVAL